MPAFRHFSISGSRYAKHSDDVKVILERGPPQGLMF